MTEPIVEDPKVEDPKVEDPKVEDPKSEFKVPDDYKDLEWAKEVKSPEDLWSRTAGLYKKLGQDPVVIPGADAAQDVKDAFYAKLGRPETPEGYEFKVLESLKDAERNPDIDKITKQIMHKHNVPKATAEAIMYEFEEQTMKLREPEFEAAAKKQQAENDNEAKYQELVTTVLGDDIDETVNAFKSVMRETMGDKAYVQDYLSNLKNEEMINLMVFAKAINDKYAGESKVRVVPGSNGSDLTGDIKTDYQTLSQRKLNIKTDANIPEHVKKQKLNTLNSQMMKIGEKAREQNIDLFSV